MLVFHSHDLTTIIISVGFISIKMFGKIVCRFIGFLCNVSYRSVPVKFTSRRSKLMKFLVRKALFQANRVSHSKIIVLSKVQILHTYFTPLSFRISSNRFNVEVYMNA